MVGTWPAHVFWSPTPIPWARYLDIKHNTNEDLYMVAPAFQAAAYQVPDNSLSSWAAPVPPSHSSHHVQVLISVVLHV